MAIEAPAQTGIHPEQTPVVSAREIIDQFRSEIGFANAENFDITNNGIKVKYEQITGDEDKKRPQVDRLTVFMGIENATASIIGETEQIGWASHGKDLVHTEDPVEAGEKMKKILSKFLSKPQE